MSMSVRDLLQQRNTCKQCHDWARVSDLALNVPAIRFMGAHARRRVSCFSLAAHSTPEWHLGGTVFQFATAVLLARATTLGESRRPRALRRLQMARSLAKTILSRRLA